MTELGLPARDRCRGSSWAAWRGYRGSLPGPTPPACSVDQLHPYMVDEGERMELGVTGLAPLLPLSPPLGIDEV